MKKMLVSLLMMFSSISAFAHAATPWNIISAAKTMTMYEGFKAVKVTFHVNQYLSGTQTLCDHVTFQCLLFTYDVGPDESANCELFSSHIVPNVVTSYIESDKFKNGAEGTYTLSLE